MERFFVAAGAASAFCAVAAGAFGAHALRQKLPPDLLSVFETASRYQIYHSLALILVAWAMSRWPGSWLTLAGWCFIAGTILFCGSLYTLALTGFRWMGAVTPLGGIALLIGWLSFALGALKRSS